MAGSLVAEVLERPATGAHRTSFRKSVVLGIASGAIGRGSGLDYLPASLPILDTLRGRIFGKQALKENLGYALGVATVYSDKIYNVLAQHSSTLERAGEFIKDLV